MYHHLPVNQLSKIINSHPDCIILDTARPSAEQRYSFVFVKPRQVLVCKTFEELPVFFKTIDALSKHRWVAGYFSYEAAYGFEERFSKFTVKRRQNELAWFGVFDTPYIFDHCSGTWNHNPGPAPEKTVHSPNNTSIKIHHTITDKKYMRAVEKVRLFIAAGDIYQVNFTYDTSVSSPLSAWDLYLSLRNRQPVPFGAFIKTKNTSIASFSPELFFLKQGPRIVTRPMKGTARRGRWNSEDRKLALALAADPKNRSENVMIVDLLRNDLGKICKTGTVITTSLFDVERHPTVLQMTSTIEGALKKNTSLSSIFRAIFPCGSVTGAPKIRAMEIIRALEKGERGVYCGAIGYSSPSGRSVFSVPIRTLQRKSAGSPWRYRVGSGIVWDSSPKEEWQECRDKCRFLVERSPDFKLFESILFDKQKLVFLSEHKKRLLDAAEYFGFNASGKAWDAAVRTILVELGKKKSPHKFRILVDKAGVFCWDSEPIESPLKNNTQYARVSDKPINSDTPFLFHKTTVRPWYEMAMKAIRRGKCFDVIHYNKNGQLTEGARSNIFLKINNQLYTPPVECGLLPGVLRGQLLKTGKCRERILKKDALKKAEAVYCGNSVRGLVEVAVVMANRKSKAAILT